MMCNFAGLDFLDIYRDYNFSLFVPLPSEYRFSTGFYWRLSVFLHHACGRGLLDAQ